MAFAIGFITVFVAPFIGKYQVDRYIFAEYALEPLYLLAPQGIYRGRRNSRRRRLGNI